MLILLIACRLLSYAHRLLLRTARRLLSTARRLLLCSARRLLRTARRLLSTASLLRGCCCQSCHLRNRGHSNVLRLRSSAPPSADLASNPTGCAIALVIL